MLILPEHGACFIAIPKTGGQAMASHLESHLRTPESRTFDVEALHDWHANIEEVESTGALPFSLYDMWSFAVVRNPFDRLVSYCAFNDDYFHHDPRGSLDAHLKMVEEGDANRWLLPQSYFAAGVKCLYRFEELDSAVLDINARFGIEGSAPLPVINESKRGRYAAYFDRELKARAEEAYKVDLLNFDYRF